jgi:hypothetical protein
VIFGNQPGLGCPPSFKLKPELTAVHTYESRRNPSACSWPLCHIAYNIGCRSHAKYSSFISGVGSKETQKENAGYYFLSTVKHSLHYKMIQVSPVAILLFTNQEFFHMHLSLVNRSGIRFLSIMPQFPQRLVVKISTSIRTLLHSI